MTLKYHNVESRRCALQCVIDMLVHIFIGIVMLMRRKLNEEKDFANGMDEKHQDRGSLRYYLADPDQKLRSQR